MRLPVPSQRDVIILGQERLGDGHMLRRAVDSGLGWRSLLRDGRWGDAMEVLGAQPWFWVVVAVCPVAAGVMASLYPTHIQNGLRPFFWPQHRFDLPATAFWVAVVFAGGSFGLAQWSQGKAGESLRTMVRRLQTLPPGGFLESFRNGYRVAARQALLVTLNPSSTLDQTDHAIRNVLGTIVELARDFDEEGAATYGANLMLFRPPNGAFESKEPMHLVSYSPGDPDVKGYLELVTCLSTTTALQTQQYSPDPQISPIVLPITARPDKILDAKSHARDPVLPGAAQAFLHQDYVAFESVEAYIHWLDVHSSRGLEIVNPLKQYFVSGAGKHVKSFGSRPIVGVGQNADAIAVLNIHSDREFVLQDSGQTLFAPLIEPFCFLLATLLETRRMLVFSNRTETRLSGFATQEGAQA